jgi:hypothetical protein
MRYLAQHKEQRERLLDLLDVAAVSLRDLMGLEDKGPAHVSYAAAVATSAPRQPRLPKKATATPTTKAIQHTVTHYERVSRELPGAPRDTLLKIVANSDLKTAPTPISEAPKPRKQPACLVKGIRANTIATCLPEGAKTPASIPAVIFDTNKELKKQKLEGQITEILQGVRRHVTIVFNQVVDHTTSQHALRTVLARFSTTREEAHVLTRPTHSILKFTAMPTVTPDGQEVTSEMAATCLFRHPLWKEVGYAGLVCLPCFVVAKTNPAPHCATLQIKVKDTQKASMAKKLLETSVSFVGVTRRYQPWTVSPTARQCTTCY